MLGKDLFKHVPTGNGFCIHRAAPIWGVWWCYRGTLYHVQAAKATPSSGPLPDFISFCLSPQPSARTEAKNANSCTIQLNTKNSVRFRPIQQVSAHEREP